MRRKVITTVVTFSTTTAAMKREKTARESEFPGRLIPIPSEISAQCGLAWKCVEQSEEETENFLKKKELAWDLPLSVKSFKLTMKISTSSAPRA